MENKLRQFIVIWHDPNYIAYAAGPFETFQDAEGYMGECKAKEPDAHWQILVLDKPYAPASWQVVPEWAKAEEAA